MVQCTTHSTNNGTPSKEVRQEWKWKARVIEEAKGRSTLAAAASRWNEVRDFLSPGGLPALSSYEEDEEFGWG